MAEPDDPRVVAYQEMRRREREQAEEEAGRTRGLAPDRAEQPPGDGSSPLSDLPHELHSEIRRHLDTPAKRRAAATSKRMRARQGGRLVKVHRALQMAVGAEPTGLPFGDAEFEKIDDPSKHARCLAALHRLLKKSGYEDTVVEWLKKNPKLRSDFDDYLRYAKKPHPNRRRRALQSKSHSRWDGTTRARGPLPRLSFRHEDASADDMKRAALGVPSDSAWLRTFMQLSKLTEAIYFAHDGSWFELSGNDRRLARQALTTMLDNKNDREQTCEWLRATHMLFRLDPPAPARRIDISRARLRADLRRYIATQAKLSQAKRDELIGYIPPN